MNGPLRFGYGTNGFADHPIDDVIAVLAGMGYDGIALTLDHQHLDPFDADLARQVRRVGARLAAADLAVVIETGARYLLDPWHKHSPTLTSPDGRERRLDLLRRAVGVGADLGAEAVSFWSGTVPAGVPTPWPGSCWLTAVPAWSRRPSRQGSSSDSNPNRE
nr:TIM barrel protein [Frankia sp. Cr1]